MKAVKLLLLAFQFLIFSAHAVNISGYLFEDVNYGGVSRGYSSSMSPKTHVALELYKEGTYQKTVTTDIYGYYSFTNVSANKNYSIYIRNINYIPSVRLNGTTCTALSYRECSPVIVSPAPAHDHYGFHVGTSNKWVDIGLNYNSVINTNDSGIGSLRQAIINASYLSNNYLLNQDCNYCVPGKDNIVFAFNKISQHEITLTSPIEMSYNGAGQHNTYVNASQFNIKIKNNNAIASWGDNAFNVTNFQDNLIEGFTIDGFYQGIYIDNCQGGSCNANINGNRIINSVYSAISVESERSVNIFNNVIESSGEYDIYAYRSRSIDISSNLFSFSGANSIYLEDSDDNGIENNVFDNSFSSSSDDNLAATIYLSGTNNTNGSSFNEIENNIIRNTAKNNTNLHSESKPSAIRVHNGHNNELSENNRGLSIDLGYGTVHVGHANENDGGYTISPGTSNHLIDSPTIIGYSLNGTSLYLEGYIGSTGPAAVFGGSDIEVYIGTSDITGEPVGNEYLDECEAKLDGSFKCTIDVSGSGFQDGDLITAIAIDDDDDTSEFGALGGKLNKYGISGRVYEDYNYGGVIRHYDNALGMSALSGVDVKLYSNNIHVSTTTTDSNGEYFFSFLDVGTYKVQVENIKLPDSVRSMGSGYYCSSCEPILVYPTLSDTLHHDVILVSSNETNVDIGFNFNTVINNYDSGIGSLRHVLNNINNLVDELILDQDCSSCEENFDNVIFNIDNTTIYTYSPLELNSKTYVDGTNKNIDIRFGATPGVADYAFEIYFTSNARIRGLTFDNFDDVFNIKQSDHITIDFNTLKNGMDSAIYLEDSTYTVIANNLIENFVNSETTKIQAAAIYFNGGRNNTISRNTFRNIGLLNSNSWNETISGIRISSGDSNWITKNSFDNIKGIGIDLNSTSSNSGLVNVNDDSYSLSSSNDYIDHPIIESVVLSGNQLTVSGYVGIKNSTYKFSDTEVEVYQADLNSANHLGTDYSAGLHYIGTCDVNSVDEFSCVLAVPANLDWSLSSFITGLTISKSNGNTSEFGLNYELVSPLDYGDAPQNINLNNGWGNANYPTYRVSTGASHRESSLCLGATSPSDCSSFYDVEADGDGTKLTADSETTDDGVLFNPNDPVLSQSSNQPVLQTNIMHDDGSVSVVENELIITASQPGFISIWLDLNQDGDWNDTAPDGTSEHIIQGIAVAQGSQNSIKFSLSASTPHGNNYLRIRYASTASEIATPANTASDGEVEDYNVVIAAPSISFGGCLAGVQNGSFELNDNNQFTPDDETPGWSVIPVDLNPRDPENAKKIEIATYSTFEGVTPPRDGTQKVAELNANVPGTLYQDIVTVPGTELSWSFDYIQRSLKRRECSILGFSAVCDQKIRFSLGGVDEASPAYSHSYEATPSWFNHKSTTISQKYIVPAGQYVTRLAFKADKPMNKGDEADSIGNIIDNVQFGCKEEFDYGDAPNEDLKTGWEVSTFPVTKSDDGARHYYQPDVFLGTAVTKETDGNPERTASSDNGDDGVLVNPNDPLISKSGKSILHTNYLDGSGVEQVVTNELVITASQKGFVSVWLDLNQDGSWSGFARNKQNYSERVLTLIPVEAGINTIPLSLSAYDVHGESWMRVRYSTLAVGLLEPTGVASNGEVEDYQVWIAAPSLDIASCDAGLQNGSFEQLYLEYGHNNYDTPESSIAGWSVVQVNPKLMPHSGKISDRNQIESSRYGLFVTDPPLDGSSNVAELSAFHPGILYQDIVTEPGSVLTWSFDYSKREKGGSPLEIMSLDIGAPDNAPSQLTIVGKSFWQTFTGLYTVPAGQYLTRIAFRGVEPSADSAGNIIDNANFGCVNGFDYGDIPSQYNDNDEFDHHIVSSQLYIGNNIPDVETTSQGNSAANGDDVNGINDENSYPNNIYIDTTKAWSTDVTVVNNTGSDAYLVGWIDINTNDKMNDLESTYQRIPSNGRQTVTLTWSATQLADAGSQMSPSYMRLRLGTQIDSDKVIDDSVIQLGEIEDHRVYLMPQTIIPENTCSSFVQTKATGSKFSYSKWNVKNGLVEFSDLNKALAVPWINAIGLNVVDGLIYGISTETNKGLGKVQLAVADQSPGAEFIPLGEIKAAHNLTLMNLQSKTNINYVKGQTLTFGKDASLVYKANQGAVTLDGKYLILIYRQWGDIIKVNLKTLEFTAVPIDIAKGFAISTLPWDPDIAFTFYGDQNLAYGVRLKSKKYYTLDINTGEVKTYNFTFEIPTALAPGGGLGYSGGYAMDTSGVIYAMTNGGNHDTNGDGTYDLMSKTALYRVDTISGKASFQLEGQNQSLRTNDAAGCLRQADYADAMIDDGGAEPPHHYKSNLYLGATWNSNFSSLWDAEANADLDDDGLISIDGLSVGPIDHHIPLQDGKTHRLVINASQALTLSMWFDWNNSQTLEISEKSVFSLSSGNNSIDITVPKGTKGDVLMRMRASTVSVPSTGLVIGGEVEDYLFEVKSAVSDISVVADNYNPLTCEVVTIDITTLDDKGVPINFDEDIEISVNKLSGNGSLSGSCWLSASNNDPSSGSNKCSSPITVKYNDESVRQVYLESYYEGMELSVHAEVVKDNKVSNDSNGIVFRKEGYVLDVELGDNHPITYSPYYLSGEEFKITLTRQTVVDGGGSPICQVNKDYEGTKNVNVKVDYALGTQSPMGLRVGDVSAPENVFDSHYTSIATDFVSGKAVIGAAYFDAGMIQILTEYVPDGGVSGGWDHSKSMSVVPYELQLDAIESDLNGVIVSNPVGVTEFVPAQTPFDVTVKAVAKDGTVTPNFNYVAPTVIGSIVTPASRTLGQLDIPTTLDFTSGLSEVVGYKYHEVGSLELNYTADKYLGLTTTHLTLDTGTIGHFYPAQFEVLNDLFSSDTEHSVGSNTYWSYYGKPDLSLNLTLQAQGSDGGALSYYDHQLFTSPSSLVPTNIEFSMTNSGFDLCAQEVLMTQSLPIDFTTNNCNFMSQWINGQYTVSESNMWVIRSVNTQDEPLAPQSGIEATLLANNDNVPYILNGQTTEKISHQLDETLDLRFGRLTLADTHGAVDISIPMPMNIEFWDGDSFEINEWDITSEVSAIGVFVAPAVEPTGLNVTLSSPSLTDGRFEFDVAGDAEGNAVIEFDLQDTTVDAIDDNSSDWLGYCWRLDQSDSNEDECTDEDMYQQNPSAVAIFGEQRKSDNLIFWRELFN